MTRSNWIVAACVSLFVIAGGVAGASAQQPPAATDTKPSATETKPSGSDSAPAQPAPISPAGEDKTSPATPSPGVRADQPQTAPGQTVIDRQVETRTERVERAPAKFFGLDPMVALIVGAVVLIVVVLGIVAMSRREQEPHRHTV